MVMVVSQNEIFSDLLRERRDRAGHETWQDVAKAADVGEATVYRVIDDPKGEFTSIQSRNRVGRALGFGNWFELIEWAARAQSTLSNKPEAPMRNDTTVPFYGVSMIVGDDQGNELFRLEPEALKQIAEQARQQRVDWWHIVARMREEKLAERISLDDAGIAGKIEPEAKPKGNAARTVKSVSRGKRRPTPSDPDNPHPDFKKP